jgi:hypothetical protein
VGFAGLNPRYARYDARNVSSELMIKPTHHAMTLSRHCFA